MSIEYFSNPKKQLLSYSVDIQLYEILETLKMSAEDVINFRTLLGDLQSAVNKIWQGCSVRVFGSVVTGLALKNSDIDFYIKLPPGCSDNAHDCINRVYRYVTCRLSPFEVVSRIYWTRVPVITLFHNVTERNCDVTFSGAVAVETSRLIKYLLSLDEQARALAKLIKYFFNIYKLTAGKYLTNHAITLLVIFFLQTKNILPSVALLQKKARVIITAGWNTAFFQPMRYPRSYNNNLYFLLKQFFVFYTNFDFENLVICPYLGYPLKKSTFLNPTNCPDEFRLYREHLRTNSCKSFMITDMCVQDPFEHNRNCTEFVSTKLLEGILIFFGMGALYFDSSDRSVVLRSLIFNAENVSLLSEPPITWTHYYPLKAVQGPEKKRSWSFYIIIVSVLVISSSLFSTALR